MVVRQLHMVIPKEEEVDPGLNSHFIPVLMSLPLHSTATLNDIFCRLLSHIHPMAQQNGAFMRAITGPRPMPMLKRKCQAMEPPGTSKRALPGLAHWLLSCPSLFKRPCCETNHSGQSL